MGMAIWIGTGDTSTHNVITTGWVNWPLESQSKSYMDCPPDWTIRRHRRLLRYIHVMTRKGFACWMIETPRAPERMWFGLRREVRRAVRPARRVRMNYAGDPRPPPVNQGQSVGLRL